jgi:hypothetical protein
MRAMVEGATQDILPLGKVEERAFRMGKYELVPDGPIGLGKGANQQSIRTC